MKIEVYNIVTDNGPMESFEFFGPDVEMNESIIQKICQQNITDKCNCNVLSFNWKWVV